MCPRIRQAESNSIPKRNTDDQGGGRSWRCLGEKWSENTFLGNIVESGGRILTSRNGVKYLRQSTEVGNNVSAPIF